MKKRLLVEKPRGLLMLSWGREHFDCLFEAFVACEGVTFYLASMSRDDSERHFATEKSMGLFLDSIYEDDPDAANLLEEK